MATASIHRPLPPELVDAQHEIEGYARDYGLDFFTTIFELVDADQLNAIAAYGGFPVRYPHWRFGMEYERLSKGYAYGLQKIYELVINNDPCYAYLLDNNSFTDHKLVMAHVYGHCDFFKCNAWFAETPRNMIDEMANHGNRIRRYMDRFGVEEVENFIDCCLSIEDLIDIYSPFIRRPELDSARRFGDPPEPPDEPTPRFQAKSHMDPYINPPEWIARQAEKRQQEQRRADERFPREPIRDVMWFLLQHAPLKSWQLDILSMLREEAYYFSPQGQTKIMNEGWASYWHSTIMTRHAMNPSDVIEYADHCSGTLATSPTRLNPYKLGIELFRDIEDRWNRGCFGEEYESCDDHRAKQQWNRELGLGREKIFEVRRIHNDLTFIDEFFTLDFCRRNKLFQFGYNDDAGYYEIESREFPKVKAALLFNLTNMGRPIIRVTDGNHKNRGELYLTHEYNGVELKQDYARDTLMNLQRLWNRPVHIETVVDDEHVALGFDGHEFKKRKAGKKPKHHESGK